MWLPLLFVLLSPNCISASKVEVSTPLGRIQGTTLTSRLGKTIYTFRGIRYAKPPVEELRFQDPVPVEKWTGVYNATVDGPMCPQPHSLDPISEDCLLLNIYSTKLPHGKRNPKRPVIVFLHPGAFYAFTTRSRWLGPQYFMDQDIVLVTVNYRLGSLGFISVGKEAPGNYGLKDQVMGMKFVKNNIASFGGDPDAITLYGYSAGAWSITLHMVSPMSRGLFHKAIIGSGSALGHWPLPKSQLNLAQKQARFVGCPENSPKEILDCLKTKSAEEIGSSLPQFAEFGTDLGLVWSPVIEEDYGQERFLPDDPIKLINSGNFEKIPIIAGITKDEFANSAIALSANATLLQQLNDNFETYAPIAFVYERDTSKSREVSRKVRQFYLGDQTITNDSLPTVGKIYADSVVGFPVNRAVDLISRKNDKPVYYYEFTYQGRYSFFYLPGTTDIPYGVVHHDDLMYVFFMGQFPFFDSNYPEAEMVETLSSLWATFAKTGSPNDCKKRTEWPPYTIATKKYLDIGKTLVVKENLNEERYSFWWKLYPLPA